MPRIGILGGTFDPPHAGHLALARCGREHLSLDEVIFLPAFRNPLKTYASDASPAQRLAMVTAMVQDEEGFAVSDIELTREGPSYMVETLEELAFARPAQYWLLMGADSVKTFPEWKNAPKILKLARLGVAPRGDRPVEDYLRGWSDDLRVRVDVLPMEIQPISSTDLRDLIASDRSTLGYLPAAVESYIRATGLYA